MGVVNYGSHKVVNWSKQIGDKLTFPNPFDDEDKFCAFIVLPNGKIKVPAYIPMCTGGAINVTSDTIEASTKDSFNLRDFQEIAKADILENLSGETSSTLLTATTGSGKALPLDEPVLTPNGWINNGDLVAGDFVIGSSGTPIKVLKVHPPSLEECYTVEFSDGSTVRCSGEHLWSVTKSRGCKVGYRAMRTSDMFTEGVTKLEYSYGKLNTAPNFKIPLTPECHFGIDTPDMLLHPYVLGVLLGGSGFTNQKVINLTNKSLSLIEKVCSLLPEGSDYRIEEKRKGAYRFYSRGTILSDAVKSLGLNGHRSEEKFIPKCYMNSSLESRKQVYQGLIDTDGYVKSGILLEYSTSSKQLALDFHELALGLGIKVSKISSRIPTYTYKGEKLKGKTNYRIREKTRYNRHPIVSITKSKNKIPMQCITVDSDDHLYVTSGFKLTHNSYMLGSVIVEVGQRVLVLAHLSMLIDQMYEELTNNLNADIRILGKNQKDFGDINLCTFQFLMANQDILEQLKDAIGFVVVDECENIATPSRLGVYWGLTPKYSLLMSATPTRELTGRTPVVKYLYDKTVEMVPDTEVAIRYVMLNFSDLSWLAPMNTNMYKSSLVKFLMSSGITEAVIELTKELIETYEGCVWIIAESLKLQDYIAKRIDCEIINGKTSAKNRKRILASVKDGTTRVLVGSAPFSAGLSIQNLAFAFRLQPHSSSPELLDQQIGRLKRYAKFKDTQIPIWFDFAIRGSLEYASKLRYKAYPNPEFVKIHKFELKG